MPMNTEIKKQWVEILRRPESKQTTGHLRDKNGQCCLDFLNQMCSDAGFQPQPFEGENGNWLYEDTEVDELEDAFPYQEMVLTNACMKWAGLDDRDPEVTWAAKPPHISWFRKPKLSYLNDRAELSLSEIADLIEADEDL